MDANGELDCPPTQGSWRIALQCCVLKTHRPRPKPRIVPSELFEADIIVTVQSMNFDVTMRRLRQRHQL